MGGLLGEGGKGYVGPPLKLLGGLPPPPPPPSWLVVGHISRSSGRRFFRTQYKEKEEKVDRRRGGKIME